jgi:DNA transformation protein and related proteins
MGFKGDKLSSLAEQKAAEITDRLNSIGNITSNKMFGGYGFSHNDQMFGIIDPKGTFFLKADGALSQALLGAGGSKHGSMPYYSIPKDLETSDEKMLALVNKAISDLKKS